MRNKNRPKQNRPYNSLDDNEPFKKRRRPPSPREYRKKRRRCDNIWTTMEIPEQVDSIKALINFSYTYQGPNVNVEQLKLITGPLMELDRMVGLKNTKRSILDMIMHFSQGIHKKNEDYLHMVVCGPPGCGKTSFCRILGKILSGLGILSKNTFTVVK